MTQTSRHNSEKGGNMGGKERVKELVSRFEGALLDQPNVQWLAQHLLLRELKWAHRKLRKYDGIFTCISESRII